MNALTSQEARDWCEERSISLSGDGFPHYRDVELGFTIRLPEKAARLTALTAWLLQESEKVPFQGALLWVKEWGIWAEHTEEAGIKIMEALRSVRGETRPLEEAPAMLFGSDELRDLHAFFIAAFRLGRFYDSCDCRLFCLQ